MVNMSAGHLAPAGGGFEPQRAYNWTIIIPGLDDVELIRLSAERVQLPRLNTAVILMRYMNEDVKVAGAAHVDANSVTIRDFVDRPTYKTLKKWFDTVHTWEDSDAGPAGTSGFAKDYKKQATIQLLDPNGNVVRQVTAKGVWPSQFSASDLDYNTDNQEVKISMTLQVDRYKMEL